DSPGTGLHAHRHRARGHPPAAWPTGGGGHQAMKSAGVLLTIIVSVILQVTLARYTVGGRWVFDFVLVGVVFAGLQWGPASGIVGGTVGGLLQDVLAGQIVGVGG